MNATPVISWLPANVRERRILAVALVVLVIAIVAAIVVVPVVLLHRHYDEHLASMNRQLRGQSALNAARQQLVRALESLKANDSRKLFLRGTTVALASAELQDKVKQVIESAGGKVSLVQGIAPKDDGPYRAVAATFHLNVSISNLRRILHAVETQEPYFFIDNLTIRALVPSGFRPQPGMAEPEVFAQVDVSGVARLPAESAGAQGGTSGSGGQRPAGGAKS